MNSKFPAPEVINVCAVVPTGAENTEEKHAKDFYIFLLF